MNNSTPLYRQIANKIREEIIHSNLAKGEAIPSEHKLAEKYKVSRVTIRQAIDILVKEDILYKIQGSGTYVKTNRIEHYIYKLQGFTEKMLELNNKPTNKVLEFKMMEPDEKIREILNINPSDKVYYVKRLRCVEDEPMVLEETYLPISLFPDLSLEVMEKSKYEYVENKGYVIDKRAGTITPLLPDKALMKVLGLKDKVPILTMKVWSNFKDGTVFEYSILYFRSDKYTFKFESYRD